MLQAVFLVIGQRVHQLKFGKTKAHYLTKTSKNYCMSSEEVNFQRRRKQNKVGGAGVYPRKILKNKCSEIASESIIISCFC